MTESDVKMLEEVKSISARGNNAEVKRDRQGRWIIYEIKKKKKQIG